MNCRESSIYGILYALLSGILFSGMGYFGLKLINNDITISNMLFLRFIVSAASMLPLILFFRKWEGIDKKSIIITFLLGAIFYSISSGVFFVACELIGTGLSMVIFFSFPLIVPILYYVIDKKTISKIEILTIISSIIGLYLIAGHENNKLEFMGFIYAFVTALTYAFYVYISKSITKTINAEMTTFALSLGSMFPFMIISIYSHSIILPSSLDVWFNLIAFGILCTSLPIWFFTKSLQYIDATKASMLSILEPVFTILIGVMFMNEKIENIQIPGIILVLASATLIQFDRKTIKKVSFS